MINVVSPRVVRMILGSILVATVFQTRIACSDNMGSKETGNKALIDAYIVNGAVFSATPHIDLASTEAPLITRHFADTDRQVRIRALRIASLASEEVAKTIYLSALASDVRDVQNEGLEWTPPVLLSDPVVRAAWVDAFIENCDNPFKVYNILLPKISKLETVGQSIYTDTMSELASEVCNQLRIVDPCESRNFVDLSSLLVKIQDEQLLKMSLRVLSARAAQVTKCMGPDIDYIKARISVSLANLGDATAATAYRSAIEKATKYGKFSYINMMRTHKPKRETYRILRELSDDKTPIGTHKSESFGEPEDRVCDVIVDIVCETTEFRPADYYQRRSPEGISQMQDWLDERIAVWNRLPH